METNPNVIYSQALKLHADIERRTDVMMKRRYEIRRDCFRLAKLYHILQTKHHKWFMDEANSVGGIQALLSRWFGSLTLLGEDYRKLISDVTAGATEAEYLTTSAGAFNLKKRVKRELEREVLIKEPPAPDKLVSPEEANRLLRANVAALTAQIRQLKSIVAEQAKRIAALQAFERTYSGAYAGASR